jgi:acetyl-CoA C-acetyltransferase
MVPVSARAELSHCPGARIAGHAALEAARLTIADIDLVELYSCFPVAVETYAEALALPLERDLTVTGGMPFAGGPYNNYVLQATVRAAELLRQRGHGTALIGSVSGVLTKQGFGLWSTQGPATEFEHVDVSAEVAAAMPTVDVLANYNGPARVAGYTVLHGRDSAPRGVALLDTPAGQRVLATSEDEQLIASMEIEEWVGRSRPIAGTTLL